MTLVLMIPLTAFFRFDREGDFSFSSESRNLWVQVTSLMIYEVHDFYSTFVRSYDTFLRHSYRLSGGSSL